MTLLGHEASARTDRRTAPLNRLPSRPAGSSGAPPDRASASRIVVFGDDWGRHPSSIQHLTKELLSTHRIDWVNTIGTRCPRLSRTDLRRGFSKLGRWTLERESRDVPANLRVHDPWMWPGFRTRIARLVNARLLLRQLRPILFGTDGFGRYGELARPKTPMAIVTTHPLVADLVHLTPQLNWIYYCVDAFHLWPGLDQQALLRMEASLVASGCPVIASSHELAERLNAAARDVTELTHGVDLEHWRSCSPASSACKTPAESPAACGRSRARALYFGHADQRLDRDICLALAERMELDLLGPSHGLDPALARHPHIHCRKPVRFEDLPRQVSRADVLVMPYAELPVTRAMQPLKLKEYLASGKPVVATPLPANLAWSDALDLAAEPEAFADLAVRRAGRPLAEGQTRARRRLDRESWGAKARRFELLIRRSRPIGVLNVRICSGLGGGPERLILPTAQRIEAHGYREEAAYLVHPDDRDFARVREEAAQHRCPLHTIPDRHPLDPSLIGRLEALCRERRISVWHGHDYKSNLLGLLLRKRLGLRLVSTVHGWVHHTSRTRLYYAVDRRALRRYERVLVVSSDLEERCREFGVPAARLRRIESAVPDGRSLPGHLRARRRLRDRRALQAGQRLVIGALGRLEPEKGFDVAIEAFERVCAAGIDAELRIAGSGGQRANLQARIERSPQAERIALCGFVPDARLFLADLDVFLLSSRREGLPLALLEAMSMGCPAVATRAGGIAEALEDEVDLLLNDVGDVEGLARSLVRVALDAELRRRLALRGEGTVRRRYGLDERVRRLARVYDELVGA